MYIPLSIIEQPIPVHGGSNTVLIISIIVGALCGTGGIASYFKARSDIRKTLAQTRQLDAEISVTPMELAQGAVLVQAQVLKDVHAELARQADEIKRQADEIKGLNRRCTILEENLHDVTVERDTLMELIGH